MFSSVIFLLFQYPLQTLAQSPDGKKLAAAALERTYSKVTYSSRYEKISYPMGDVPKNRGVCSDVVIRSYRALGVDLQQLIHEDMVANFDAYPKIWGLSKPDTNIDHRRVPNIRRFLKLHGTSMETSSDPNNFIAGDIVAFNLAAGRANTPHIGIVSAKKSAAGTPLIIHNIGSGPKLENILFTYKMTGHYRYHPKP